MTLEEEVIALRAENAALREALAGALERIAELERGHKQPPSFVKPSKPKKTGRKEPRRKRKPEQNGARRRDTPTKVVTHRLDECPDCGVRVYGHSVARRRQVIELPPPQPVEVIEHQVIKRWCPKCHRWHTPKLDLSGQVLGQGRLGVRLVSVIAYLRTVMRLPIRLIRQYLQTMHRVVLSIGELTQVLDKVRESGEAALRTLRQELRASDRLHADETSWREDGQNGYVWTFSKDGAEAICYYERHASRSGSIVQRVLGSHYQGTLSSDFYAGYNRHRGKHQRCWVHLLRDLHDLKEKQPQDKAVLAWAQAVRKQYEDAQAFLRREPQPDQSERQRMYVRLHRRVQSLGLHYARAKGHPCCTLAKRLMQFQDELFQFVLIDGLPADNNLAERSLRPVVVMRKISGGTRSKRGSDTRMALASLFSTWQARGLNPLNQCRLLLGQES